MAVKAPTSAAFSTDITTILRTAMGTAPSHDISEDNFSCTLKCHASNGRISSPIRDSMVISSYEADSILTAVEIWTDTIPALA